MMQDKSFEQALEELVERNQKGLREALEQRQLRLPHNTVASLVTDMSEGQLKEEVTDLLKVMKVLGSLDAIRKVGKWSPAEYQEIHDYVLALHLKAHTKG